MELPEEIAIVRLSPEQRAFKILQESDIPLSSGMITKLMGYTGGNASQSLIKLQRLGLIEQIICPSCNAAKVYQIKKPNKSHKNKKHT